MMSSDLFNVSRLGRSNSMCPRNENFKLRSSRSLTTKCSVEPQEDAPTPIHKAFGSRPSVFGTESQLFIVLKLIAKLPCSSPGESNVPREHVNRLTRALDLS